MNYHLMCNVYDICLCVLRDKNIHSIDSECISSGFPTVSGLSESDYPSSGEVRSARHHHTTRKVPLPSELMYHFQRILLTCVLLKSKGNMESIQGSYEWCMQDLKYEWRKYSLKELKVALITSPFTYERKLICVRRCIPGILLIVVIIGTRLLWHLNVHSLYIRRVCILTLSLQETRIYSTKKQCMKFLQVKKKEIKKYRLNKF